VTTHLDDRRIFADVETTGIHYHEGHKIVEVGLVEMINGRLTGRKFHEYVDPQRDVPEEAWEIHKLTRSDCIERGGGQIFADIVPRMLEFIAGSRLIAHNAPFDVGFIGDELKGLGQPTLVEMGIPFTCTLALARAKYGQGATLDQLNRRLLGDAQIEREAHGALLDSEILAAVYQVMTIEQTRMVFDNRVVLAGPKLTPERVSVNPGSLKRTLLTGEDRERHEKLCQRIRKASGGACLSDAFEM
jgi:DNA polymerase-3 subunit epsilon